jgi:hypothetical protein
MPDPGAGIGRQEAGLVGASSRGGFMESHC